MYPKEIREIINDYLINKRIINYKRKKLLIERQFYYYINIQVNKSLKEKIKILKTSINKYIYINRIYKFIKKKFLQDYG